MGEEAGGCRKTPKSRWGLNCLTSVNVEVKRVTITEAMITLAEIIGHEVNSHTSFL